MSSDISSSLGASLATGLSPNLQNPQQPAAVVSLPQSTAVLKPIAPKLEAPKPVDLHYDPNQARQNLQSALNLLNTQVASKAQGLAFSYDTSVKSPVITVRNISTGEVVRQIPSQDVLSIAHKLDQLKGILFNEKA